MPINDSNNVEVAESGSHWSLLLVSVIDGVSFHYDSLSNNNYRSAAIASDKLSRLLGQRIRFMAMTDTPQQENGSDCGMFVCLIMRHVLLKRLLQVRTDEKVGMSMGGRKIDAREGRKEMLRIIEERRREGERRRS